MTERAAKTLLLALGNDILGDDGVGFAAARELEARFAPDVDCVLSSEAGLALLELMEGYQRALLLDAIVTGDSPVGTVHEFAPTDFRRVLAPSPHYAGLPEVLELAERLQLEFPRELRVLALEVEDPYAIREGLTPGVARALPEFVARAASVLEDWGCTSSV
jgi:hydrogenase maturation protease